jgi:Uma2 family endonuclease
MVQAKIRFDSIEEYAALDASDLPACPYELVDGVIVEMGAEADRNLEIVLLLISALLKFVPYYLLRKGAEIEVDSHLVTSRFPDLMLLTEATRNAMPPDERALVKKEMPPPALVVEVVSPGGKSTDNYLRDYVKKPQEYAKRGICEYWRIDPSPDRAVVAVLRLEDNVYRVEEFRGSDRVISTTFPELTLTAEQILKAGRE